MLCIGINIQRYPAVSAMLQGKNLPSHCLGRAEFLETGESAASQSSLYQTSADHSDSQNTNFYNSTRSSRDPIPASTSSASSYSALSSENSEYYHESYANANSTNFDESKTSSQYTQYYNNAENAYHSDNSYDSAKNGESSEEYGDNSNRDFNDYFSGEYAVSQNKTEDNNEEKMEDKNDSEDDFSFSQNVPLPLTKSLSEPVYTFSSTVDYSTTPKDNANDFGEISKNYRDENDKTDNADVSQNKTHVDENYYQNKNENRQSPQDVSHDFYQDKTPKSYRQPSVFRGATPQPGYSNYVIAAETTPDIKESAKEPTKENVVVSNEKTLSPQEKLERRQSMPFVLQPVSSGKNNSANEYIPPDFLLNLDKQTKRLSVPTTELTATIIPPNFEKSQDTTDSQSEDKEIEQ
jgi:hypothetical protein